MTAPYAHDALWMKAKLFLSYALDDERTFDERALWASLSLELLAKAALTRVNPTLIAYPTDDGVSLLIASGLLPGEARFTSLPAKSLYSRCARAFKPFSDTQANKITQARNDYLHGGTAGFTSIPEVAWWPRFWSQAAILVNAMDKQVEDLVGAANAFAVEKHLEQNAKNVEHRTEMLIERAKQRISLRDSGRMPANVAAELSAMRDLTAGLSHHTDVTCPACGATGRLEGEDVLDSELHTEGYSPDDYEQWMDLTVGSDHFSCPNCKLVLNNYELIDAAGLDTDFMAIGDVADFYEGDYGND